VNPVLYVEDEENDVLLLGLSFKRAGIAHPIQTVRDGREALDYLSGNGQFSDRELYPLPCLILLDLNLPRLTGLEVLNWVRQEPRLKTMPVVVLTSSSLEEDHVRARQLGADDYVVKTGDLTRLTAIATAWKQRWMEPV
jgi:CheY-like chemotaxis protein